MCASGSRISMSASVSMSRALTSPGLSTRRYSVLVVSTCILSGTCLRLRMMSVASSTTPGIGENSWSTPSILTAVTAAPSIDDSSTRRSELPTSCRNRARTAARRTGRTDPSVSHARTRAASDAENPSTTLPLILSLQAPTTDARQTCRFTLRLPPQVWMAAGGELALLQADSYQLSALSEKFPTAIS